MYRYVSRKLRKLKVFRASLTPVRITNERFGDLDEYCASVSRERQLTKPTRSLDLGCGPSPRNPFNADELYGVDIRDNEPLRIKYADLSAERIPHADGYFDFVTAFDFIEHVPRILYAPARRFPFIELMNEIHRVLKVGGVLLSHTPAYPFAPAFQDPTHVNVITEETFPVYFAGETLGRMYGFKGSFGILRQGWRKPHLITVMTKIA